MYRIIVCVKQVPDTKNIVGEAMKPDGTINRAVLPTIFNPEDLHALEMALEIKEKHGAEIHVISMGPPAAMEVLRESIFRGADHAYLVSDRRFAASDTLATSYTLSQAIKKIGNFDLIFCGRQAIDGDTAQVGPQIAQNLGLPQITYAEKIVEVKEKTITCKRLIDNGHEVLRGKMPLMVTVLDTAPHARPRDIERTVFLRKRPIPTWSLEDIGADVQRCGLGGSPTNVWKINSVVLTSANRQAKHVTVDKNGFDQLCNELISSNIIKDGLYE